jgi:glycosyltransferase involved in cell wall biosynthesis
MFGMRVLFHTNTLNFRGTTVAATDYAEFNQSSLGHESVIGFDATIPYERDMGTEEAVINRLRSRFPVIGHNGLQDLEKLIEKHSIDVVYFLRYGAREPLPSNARTAVHAVFQAYEPHGDRYAYVSEWLSRKMTAGSVPFVPHMVNLPEPNCDLRATLSIPKGAIVVGRHGGYLSFDIPWVKATVEKVARQNNELVFLFLNTERFADLPNIIHLPPTSDPQMKSNFINACDAMLHGRARGESFGCSIFEFLHFNKPVLACALGEDQNHVETLGNHGSLYATPEDLENLLVSIRALGGPWKPLATPYAPGKVMEQFHKVFLSH